MNNDTVAKLIAIAIVGSVAKALFGQPKTVYRTAATPLRDAALSIAKDTAESAADSAAKRVR